MRRKCVKSMEAQIILSNLSNPTLLFFVLGILATLLKSDLEIPASSSKFISLYLLFSIGFKGGQELSHSGFNAEIYQSLLFGIVLSIVIPVYTFFILRQKLGTEDSGAIAASYGSVSAVTFVAAVSFLELQQLHAGGHMVAVMAFMESPAIIVGVMMMILFGNNKTESRSLGTLLHHSFTNGSVFLILGSLVIGYLADAKQAEGIKPFTTDIFKGFLSLFLLEMGMVTAARFKAFKQYGSFVSLFALLIPALNGCITAYFSMYITQDIANRFMLCVLAASASYIAVPAAMKLAAPKADPGLYIPMALGLTFPFNITLGMPLYFALIHYFA